MLDMPVYYCWTKKCIALGKYETKNSIKYSLEISEKKVLGNLKLSFLKKQSFLNFNKIS